VTLLPRFITRPPQQGGLKEPMTRRHAADVFNALLRFAQQQSAEHRWTLTLYAAEKWACVWPRPASAVGGATVTLDVSDAGIVDFSGLEFVGLEQSVFTTWFNTLKKIAKGTTTMSLEDLFLKTNHATHLRSLLGQLTWLLATRLEWKMGQLAQSKASNAIASFSWHLETGLKGLAADEYCAKYIHGSQLAMCRHKVYFMATDKGQACGLALQDTLFSAGKMLVLAPPVVGSAGDASELETPKQNQTQLSISKSSCDRVTLQTQIYAMVVKFLLPMTEKI
jgi:hypothetical protein